MAEETKKETKEKETKEKTGAGGEKKEMREAKAAGAEKKEGAIKLSAEAARILEKISALKAEDRKALGLEIVKNLTVLELSEWVKTMEDAFGVTAAAPVAAVGVAPGAAAPAAEEEEEKTSFSVILTSFGEKKIQVIKEVRAVTSLGLKEAKELVESAPKPIKEDVTKEEAEEIKKKIEAAGASVEIK